MQLIDLADENTDYYTKLCVRYIKTITNYVKQKKDHVDDDTINVYRTKYRWDGNIFSISSHRFPFTSF